MESDSAEFEVQLALTQRQLTEAQKNSKDFAIQLKDINLKNDDIVKKTDEARLESEAAQRRVNLMTDEVELVSTLQEDYVNFYAPATVNPYIALAGKGPWIITSHGAVVHDNGG